MEQPNITSDVQAALTPVFWLMVAVTGVATGLLGALMMVILFNVQHLAFGYHTGPSKPQSSTPPPPAASPPWCSPAHSAASPGSCCALHQGQAFGDRRRDLERRRRLSFRRSLARRYLRGSHRHGRLHRPRGRAQADGRRIGQRPRPLEPPDRSSGAFSSLRRRRGTRRRLQRPPRRSLFTAEVLWGSVSLPVILPAWHAHGSPRPPPGFISRPAPPTPASRLPHQRLPAGVGAARRPLIGLISAGYIRLIGWVSHHRQQAQSALRPLLAFSILGVIGIRYPELFGNGQDMAHDAFIGLGSIGLLAPCSPSSARHGLCLGSGASGGLFTRRSAPARSSGDSSNGLEPRWPGSHPAPSP